MIASIHHISLFHLSIVPSMHYIQNDYLCLWNVNLNFVAHVNNMQLSEGSSQMTIMHEPGMILFMGSQWRITESARKMEGMFLKYAFPLKTQGHQILRICQLSALLFGTYRGLLQYHQKQEFLTYWQVNLL